MFAVESLHVKRIEASYNFFKTSLMSRFNCIVIVAMNYNMNPEP